MRAWYHTADGLSADLCQLLNRESMRLILRKDGKRSESIYPNWNEAINTLKKISAEWISGLTGQPLQ